MILKIWINLNHKIQIFQFFWCFFFQKQPPQVDVLKTSQSLRGTKLQ